MKATPPSAWAIGSWCGWGATARGNFTISKTDRTELHDLAAAEPARAADLAAKWDAWASAPTSSRIPARPGQPKAGKQGKRVVDAGSVNTY